MIQESLKMRKILYSNKDHPEIAESINNLGMKEIIYLDFIKLNNY